VSSHTVHSFQEHLSTETMPPDQKVVSACLKEAKQLQSGEGITPGNLRALSSFLEAANAGHPEGQYLVGECYLNGRGVDKNEELGLEWLRKAADADFEKAFVRLGIFYQSRVGDEDQAIYWYSKAVDAGSRGACALIAAICKDRGTTADALPWEKKAALIGDQDSLWTVRAYYEDAREKGVDLAEAHAWLSLFEDGFTRERDSIYLAAYMLFPNLGSYKMTTALLAEWMSDEKLAESRMRYSELVTKRMEMVKRCADEGIEEWQYMLGWSFFNGYGGQEGPREAVKWWCLAAGQGHTMALNNLGYCYKYGRGVAQDHAEAVKLFQKAADKGCAAAQYSLGHSYCGGLGVPLDRTIGAEWIRKAAEARDATAQRNMGFLYENGWGVPQDRAEALAWYRSAAVCRPEAGKDAAAISASMLPDEIQRAEVLYQALAARRVH
jgi:TPR repeat protein